MAVGVGTARWAPGWRSVCGSLPLGAALEPVEGCDDCAGTKAAAEAVSHPTRGDQSQAYRDKDAKFLLTEHVMGLAQHHGSETQAGAGSFTQIPCTH